MMLYSFCKHEYNNHVYKEGAFMFVGREKELASLNKLYDENTFQMVVMYGRRRIGKTTLA